MDGKLIWLAGGIRNRSADKMPQSPKWVFRWTKDPDRKEDAPPYAAGYLHDIPGKILTALLQERPAVVCSSPDYMVSFFRDTPLGQYVIHCVNIAGTLANPSEKISHADPFPHFQPDAPANENTFSIEFSLPAGTSAPAKVFAASPEFKGERELAVRAGKNSVCIDIPAGTFSGYLRITWKA